MTKALWCALGVALLIGGGVWHFRHSIYADDGTIISVAVVQEFDLTVPRGFNCDKAGPLTFHCVKESPIVVASPSACLPTCGRDAEFRREAVARAVP